MTWFDGDESSATGRANFVVRDQLAFDDGAIVSRLDHACDEFYPGVARRRAQQFDRILGGDGTRWFIRLRLLH